MYTFVRYFAICHPHDYQRTKLALNPRIEVTLSLFLAFVIQLPHFLASNVVKAPCRIPRFHFNSTTDVDPIVWENYSLYPLDHRWVHVNHLIISINFESKNNPFLLVVPNKPQKVENFHFTSLIFVWMGKNLPVLRFIYFEKATKFCKISTLLLTTVHKIARWRFRKILWPS